MALDDAAAPKKKAAPRKVSAKKAPAKKTPVRKTSNARETTPASVTFTPQPLHGSDEPLTLEEEVARLRENGEFELLERSIHGSHAISKAHHGPGDVWSVRTRALSIAAAAFLVLGLFTHVSVAWFALALGVGAALCGVKGLRDVDAGITTDDWFVTRWLWAAAGIVVVQVVLLMAPLVNPPVSQEWEADPIFYDESLQLGAPPVDLVVGGCYLDPFVENERDDEGGSPWVSVPCEEPHYGEVMAVWESEWPADPDFSFLADVLVPQCNGIFADYTADKAGRDGLDFNFFYPTQGQWDAGVRTLSCWMISQG